MKLFVILYLFFFNLAFGNHIDVVFDIDGVIIDRANKDSVKHLYPPERLEELRKQGRVLEYKVHGKVHTYVLNHGAEELIEYLDTMDNVRVTFYSTGPKERNLAFLKHFRTKSGKSFLEVAENRVLSLEDSYRIADDGFAYPNDEFEKKIYTNRFDDRFSTDMKPFDGPVKKDLFKVHGIDIENAVLFEDRVSNASRGQEKNLLRVDLDLTRIPPGEVLNSLSQKLSNSITKHFYNWNNKLVLAFGVFLTALENSKSKGISLRDALWKLQWDRTSPKAMRYKYNENKPSRFFMKAEEEMQSVNERFKLRSSGLYFCNYSSLYKMQLTP